MTIYLSLAQASPPSFAGVLDGKSESVVATGGYVSLLADILTLLASPHAPAPLEISGVFVPSNQPRTPQADHSKSRTHDV